MKFYHFPVSPNSRRALAVAFHLGIEMELIPLNIPAGEHLKPEFLKLNPNHKIPTLVDGDFVLWESGAIILYLLDKKPGNSIYSDNLQKQADIHRWMFWNSAHWSPTCGIYIFEYLVKKFLKLGEPDQAELKRADELFHRFATVLDDHLKQQEWLVDNKLTAADYAVAASLDLEQDAHYPAQKYENIKRWYSQIKEQDAWKKSAPANFM